MLDGFQVFTTYTSVVVLGDLPAAVHLADRLRHPAHQAPPRRAARPPAEDPRAPRAARAASRRATTPTDADDRRRRRRARAAASGAGYRVERYGDSVSAERGYLRETGNLVFHTALIGVLVTVGIGGGFGYTGQRVRRRGHAVHERRSPSYDSFNPGRFFTEAALEPYSIALDSFDVDLRAREPRRASASRSTSRANVTTTRARRRRLDDATIKVNEPLAIGGTQVYLLGNGYAPVVTVRDPEGTVVFSQPVAVPAAGRAT